MHITQLVLDGLVIMGTFAFAVSGAMVAIQKKADLFGVLFLGVITAMGGGILRDLLLDEGVPAFFTNYRDFSIAFGTSIIVFFAAKVLKNRFWQESEKVEAINNIFDALGLGMFAVTGCQIAMSAGFGDQLLLLLSMGFITAVGGGLLRDIILREIPFIFSKHIYAVAALVGSLIWYILIKSEIPEIWAMLVAVVVTFVLRMLSTRYRWNLPKAL